MIFYAVIALGFALAMLIEGSILSFFILERALPDLFLVMIICLGFVLGERRGAIIGLCAGLLQDVVFGSALGFFALAKMLLGYGAGLLGRQLYREQLLAPVLLTFIGTLIHEILLYILVSRFIGVGMPVELSLGRLFVPKAFYNMALTLLVYPLLFRFYNSKKFLGISFDLKEGRF